MNNTTGLDATALSIAAFVSDDSSLACSGVRREMNCGLAEAATGRRAACLKA